MNWYLSFTFELFLHLFLLLLNRLLSFFLKFSYIHDGSWFLKYVLANKSGSVLKTDTFGLQIKLFLFTWLKILFKYGGLKPIIPDSTRSKHNWDISSILIIIQWNLLDIIQSWQTLCIFLLILLMMIRTALKKYGKSVPPVLMLGINYLISVQLFILSWYWGSSLINKFLIALIGEFHLSILEFSVRKALIVIRIKNIPLTKHIKIIRFYINTQNSNFLL